MVRAGRFPALVLTACTVLSVSCGGRRGRSETTLPPQPNKPIASTPDELEDSILYWADPILLELPMEVLWFDQSIPDIEEEGGIILADGQPAGLDLRELGAPEAAKSITQNSKACSSLAIDPAILFSEEVRSALDAMQLPALALALTGERLDDVDLRACLSGIAGAINIKLDEATNETLEQISGVPQVLAINASNTDIDDSGLEHVAHLNELKHLDLYATAVSDEGVALISGLTEIRVLNLGSTDVSSACVRHLRDMQELKVLDLSYVEAENGGFDGIAHLPGLMSLNLYGSGITDEDIVHLEAMSGIVHLDLTSTEISDDSLSSLGKLVSLEYLDLHETSITDRGLANLSSLTRLRRLGLSQTGITDKGLLHLYGLDSLEYLYLVDTDVTEHGIEDLLEKIPASVDGP